MVVSKTNDEAWLSSLVIEPIDRAKHDRSAFTCGIDRIDNFLKNNAAKQADADFAKVYVAVEPPSTEVVGYYALCPHAIDISSLPAEDQKRMPRYPTISAIYLSVIAVVKSRQRRGLGSFLMADALKLC